MQLIIKDNGQFSMVKKYIIRVQKHYYIKRKNQKKGPNCTDYVRGEWKMGPKLLWS